MGNLNHSRVNKVKRFSFITLREKLISKMKMMPDHFRSQFRLLSGTQRIKELQMAQHLILREEKDRRRDKRFWRERSSGPLLLCGRGSGSFVDFRTQLCRSL